MEVEPVPNGNVLIGADGRAVVISGAHTPPDDVERFRSHHADPLCPGSSEHKRRNQGRLVDVNAYT